MPAPQREWPRERPLAKRWLAPDIAATDRSLASLLSAGEKRALDLIGDWLWIAPFQLGSLLGVKRSRLAELIGRLIGLDLVVVHRPAALAPDARRPRHRLPRPPRPGSRGRGPPTLECRTARPESCRPIGATSAAPAAAAAAPPRSHRVGASVHHVAGRTSSCPRLETGATRFRPTEPRATSAMTTGACGPSNRMRSPSSGEQVRFVRSSSSGSGEPSVPSRCSPASPPTSAITAAIARPTTHGVQPTVLVVFEDALTASHFLRTAREHDQSAASLTSVDGLRHGQHSTTWTTRTGLAITGSTGMESMLTNSR